MNLRGNLRRRIPHEGVGLAAGNVERNRADSYLQQLWTKLQEMPEYRGDTALISTTDHGRGGDENKGWKSHGQK